MSGGKKGLKYFCVLGLGFLCFSGSAYGQKVNPISCQNQEEVVMFRLVATNNSIPPSAYPDNLFSPYRLEPEATQRLRLDGCLNNDGEVKLRRIVTVTKSNWSPQASFREYYFTSDDTTENYHDALFGGNHEGVRLIERIGLIGRDQFLIHGFKFQGQSYVAAGAAKANTGSTFFLIGRLDDLSELFGECDSGFQPMKGFELTIGSAKIVADLCLQHIITGESRAYALKLDLQDDHPFVRTGDQPYRFHAEGPAARESMSGGTGHHGCWQRYFLKTPRGTYHQQNRSLSQDNFIWQEIQYEEQATPIKLSLPAPAFSNPC